MHLYLEKKEKVRNLIVYLLEGHAPRIAGLSGPNTEVITSGLEPGIWFKVMVLDKVHVNCNTHVVSWAVGGQKEKVGRQLFGSQDHYVYDFDDDVDELFKLADYVIETNPLTETDEDVRKEKIQEYEQTLFRMLHCYILSKIELYPEDQERVTAAYQSQVTTIQQLEKETLVHSRLSEHYNTKKIELLQKDILPSMEDYIQNGEVDKELLAIVIEDINKILPSLRERLDVLSQKTEELKSKCQTEDRYQWYFEELSDARGQRNAVSAFLNNCLTSRETVKELQRASVDFFPPVAKLTAAAKLYMEYNRKIKVEKQISNQLVKKKVLAASVRESLYVTEAALRQGETSLGEEITTDGQRTTNVNMDVGSNAEWLTLSERLATIVHNPEHPIGSQFLDFTNRVKLKCEAIKKTVEGIVNSPTSKLDKYLDYYVISEEDVRVDKVVLEDMRMEILLHLLKMSDLLIDFFKNCNKVFLNKVRLSYEKCFFNKVGDHLVELYRLVHGATMKSLENRIKCVREYPICQLGLQMKDEWWLSLLDHKSVSHNASFDVGDNVNGGVGTDFTSEHTFANDEARDKIGCLERSLKEIRGKPVSRSTGHLESQVNSDNSGRQLETQGMQEENGPRGRAYTVQNVRDGIDISRDRGMPANSVSFSDDTSDSVTNTNSVEIYDTTDNGNSEASAANDPVNILCKNLQSSKEKVLSRSSGNLLALGLANTHDHRREAEEMEQEIELRGMTMASFRIGETEDTLQGSDVASDSVQSPDGIVNETQKEVSRSNSTNGLEDASFRKKSLKRLSNRRPSYRDTFRIHFGPTMKSMRNIFDSHSPLMKMQCLTAALKLVVDKVVELRLRAIDTDEMDRSRVAVSADDLLPLIVLLLLKLEPVEVGLLFVELIYISDLMADFLAAGCHSYALTEFQIAFRVLDQTCEELDI